MKTIGIVIGVLFTFFALAAEIPFAFDQLFSDNAVLQRDLERHPVWGTAPAGSALDITFRGKTVKATANEAGSWKCVIPSGAGSKDAFELTAVCGDKKISSKNISVGEVWLVAGQSNADYALKKFKDGTEWAKDSSYPAIRYIKQTWQPPHMRKPDTWNVCSPETAMNFSALGFFFAKGLEKQFDLPVGIIVSAADGSVIARWLSREALEKIPDAAKNIIAPYDKAVEDYKIAKVNYDAEIEKRKTLSVEELASLPALQRIYHPAKMFSTCFEEFLAPVIPFPVRGIIWYQGESNAMFAQGHSYRYYLDGMIDDYRTKWKRDDLPFLIVEIPRFKQTYVWADLRDSQKFVADKKNNVDLVTILDLGELDDIHPPRKKEAAERILLSALKNVYGKNDIVASGPVYRSMKIDGDSIIIEFDSTADSLVSSDGQTLREFTIAADDKKFFPADAVIKDKNTVSVRSERVKNPVAVRYAWRDTVDVNLFNSKGLSAGQFRTDNWKIPTQRD